MFLPTIKKTCHLQIVAKAQDPLYTLKSLLSQPNKQIKLYPTEYNHTHGSEWGGGKPERGSLLGERTGGGGGGGRRDFKSIL